ncbi:MAG TPA: cysteine--1-D-myo-inosityl 2-amino-2-deoxy-alpha-D-glucopyranoside ligase [Candidatus Paceibacterota bacterium]|nr:cysteine--1-D-myo-inosityl 2-amino-2-deoxy-alpha-D-glucopyranoside ligase [Candidatus Paceibacterota bacterium]
MKSWASLYLPPIAKRFNFPPLRLHNSVTGTLESLPVKSEYSMYVCGITPYDATHLGHAATYITFDLINRYLRAMGKNVHFVENITDVDDPLLERATRDNVDWSVLAHSQIELFRGDMSDLHILPPEHYIGAVEAIPLIVKMIEALKSKGAVYLVDDDLYFSVHMDKDFGTRSNLSQESMLELFGQRGGDPDRVGKHDKLDALLWMRQRPNEPGWASSFGKGRPGWHVECCAIALNYLPINSDDKFLIDIQGGGSDLLFPHHEMGASQAAVVQGREFARFYVHTGMIGLDGEKMSKSLGNLVFLSELVNAGEDPMAIRLALIRAPYAADRMWSDEKLISATAFLTRLRLLLSRPEVAPTDPTIESIIAALSNNLDTQAALNAIEKWCDETESGAVGGSAGELSRAIDLLLGIAI